MSEQLSYGGASSLTPFQVIGRVQRQTGLRIRMARELFLNEDLIRVVSTDTMIKLVFEVKRYRGTKRGRVLVEQGLRACALTRVGERWSVLTDLTQVAPVEEAVEEILRGRVEDPDEVMERVAYEEMCHRPGTSRFPMDNSASRAVEERVKNLLGSDEM